MVLEKIELIVLVLSIGVRFLAALNADHKKPEFKLFSISFFLKWSLHLFSCLLLFLIFPDFLHSLDRFFPKVGFANSPNLLVTFAIGFGGYDIIKFVNKYGIEILITKIRSLFHKK